MKRVLSYVSLALMMVLMTGVLTAAAPTPSVQYNLVQGLPSSMAIGETYTVIVEVVSDTPFLSVTALPSFEYPGRGVVAVRNGDRAGAETSATLELTFTAKTTTAKMLNNEAVVYVVIGTRFQGGYIDSTRYTFNVSVP